MLGVTRYTTARIVPHRYRVTPGRVEILTDRKFPRCKLRQNGFAFRARGRLRAAGYHGSVSAAWRSLLTMHGLLLVAAAQNYQSPAGIHPAQRHQKASILPGGRIISPLG